MSLFVFHIRVNINRKTEPKMKIIKQKVHILLLPLINSSLIVIIHIFSQFKVNANSFRLLFCFMVLILLTIYVSMRP